MNKLTILAGFAALGTATTAQMALLPDSGTAKQFELFDNMAYAGKPDLTTNGLVSSSVIYYRGDWKAAIAAGQLPDEESFKQAVRRRAAGKPGPVVIDIEYVFLSPTRGTTDAQVKQHFKLFITLAHWAHEAAPGHLVGFYGHGLFPEEPGQTYAAETRQLIAAVDAFFPSMYSYGNQTPDQWQKKLQHLIAQAHALAPGKPVYPYVWPQYHEGSPKALEFLDADRMKFELAAARDCGANGVVFWSSSKPRWNVEAPWWQATQSFAAAKPLQNDASKLAPSAVGKPVPPQTFPAE